MSGIAKGEKIDILLYKGPQKPQLTKGMSANQGRHYGQALWGITMRAYPLYPANDAAPEILPTPHECHRYYLAMNKSLKNSLS